MKRNFPNVEPMSGTNSTSKLQLTQRKEGSQETTVGEKVTASKLPKVAPVGQDRSRSV